MVRRDRGPGGQSGAARRGRSQRVHQDLDRGHFGSLLNAAAAEYELTVELRVAVSEAVRAAAAEPDPEPETVRPQPPVPAQVGVLNPRYTFDLFVIGPSNRFAHAAALAVAEAPAQAFNPLFIYGSTGLGKTHLLQAVAQYVIQQHPYLTVRYVTTETVLNEFVDAFAGQKHGRVQRAL